MGNEVTIVVKDKYEKLYTDGYPLLVKDTMVNLNTLADEGDIFRLVDGKNRFIGRGFYGRQNKAFGWILTNKENEQIDQKFFQKRILAAMNRRTNLFVDRKTNTFRVFNGEGDGIGGFTIDYYDENYLITWYSKGIYEYKDYVVKSLKNLVEFKSIYQKKRFDEDGKYIDEDGFIEGTVPEFPIIVKENNIKFAIYLNDGAMVGVFLDQREVRRAVRDRYAKGKNVLNTFSYTGAFSVAAALGGAKSTTSVDVANRSIEKTREHFEINRIDPDTQEIIVDDVFEFFKYAQKKETRYDLVILDPPSFAKSKKHTFSAAKDYTELMIDAIKITEKRGVMIASTNCSTFDMAKFKEMIEKAFYETRTRFKVLEEHQLPFDFHIKKQFKEGNYLKVLILQKL